MSMPSGSVSVALKWNTHPFTSVTVRSYVPAVIPTIRLSVVLPGIVPSAVVH